MALVGRRTASEAKHIEEVVKEVKLFAILEVIKERVLGRVGGNFMIVEL